MEKLCMGWWFKVLEFCFFFLFFFLPSVGPAGKYSVWSAESLPRTFGVGSQRAVAGSMGVVTGLFSQCIVM
jgi:hypothetical protein